MNRNKIIELTTSLMLLKIQFDRQFETIRQIVEREAWGEEQKLLAAVVQGIDIQDKLASKLKDLHNCLINKKTI